MRSEHKLATEVLGDLRKTARAEDEPLVLVVPVRFGNLRPDFGSESTDPLVVGELREDLLPLHITDPHPAVMLRVVEVVNVVPRNHLLPTAGIAAGIHFPDGHLPRHQGNSKKNNFYGDFAASGDYLLR